MVIFSASKLAKNFDGKQLFEDVSFGMSDGERIGIIGKNGAGKTTLMKIIAGLEQPDIGEVVFNSNVRVEYLAQMPEFDIHDVVLDVVMKGKPLLYSYLEEFHRLCDLPQNMRNKETATQVDELTRKIEELHGWNLENEAKSYLTKLNLTRFDDDVHTLSGGLKKRVALARALISEPELLILDEPTNHLDVDSVQWLQDYLQNSNRTILFVTHDRYFLDSITSKIIEIDDLNILSYPGSYQAYLEKKHELALVKEATLERKLSRLNVELAWLQRGAPARRSKQTSRIDWIDELKKSTVKVKEKDFEIELGHIFLGSRIIEAHAIEKSIGHLLFQNFTYYAKPGDRIGIIGPNGSGKSTLLKVFANLIFPDKGTIKHGQSVKFGYFKQEIDDLRDDMSVIGAIKEIAEYINVGVGKERYLTPRDLLDKFLFPRHQHSAFVSTLSGGERKRLALVRVLMNNPNILLLDEPTNDFDLQTLSAFEEYLDDFKGVLITVSHDRAFLDRTINTIYAFDGLGNIKEYPGNYTYYLQKKEKEKKELQSVEKKDNSSRREKQKVKTKLSYMEQREYDEMDLVIADLEQKKQALEDKLSDCQPNEYQLMEKLSLELESITNQIDNTTMRWLELSEMMS